jgi:hypothetical protein
LCLALLSRQVYDAGLIIDGPWSTFMIYFCKSILW